jgi:hypothetical protein
MDLLPLQTTLWFALHIFSQSRNKMKVQTYEVSADSLNDWEIMHADKDLRGDTKKLCLR